MNLTLQLQYCAEPQRPTTAWWLAGTDASTWLDAAARGGLLAADPRWIVVPADRHGSIRGAIVLSSAKPNRPSDRDASAVPLGVAFGTIGERLYVPVSAKFDPVASDAEVAALLPDDNAPYVWLPAVGLVRCDSSGVLATHQLLAAPVNEHASWDAAEPGMTLNGRLSLLLPAAAVDLNALFAQSRGDIGEQAGQWDELPAAPGEPSRWWAALPGLVRYGGVILLVLLALVLVGMLLQGGRDGSASNVLLFGLLILTLLLALGWWWLTRSKAFHSGASVNGASGVSPASGSLFGGIRQWFAAQRAGVDRRLQELRHREINRLLNLLGDDPDAGLRYAPPMMGGGLHRGRTQPGWRLVEHQVDYSWHQGGGGAADVWDIDAEHRLRLVTKYRELANREIALRRHRRAAYIFAELLGDLRAAAQTLADGGHYREAAALCEHRLNDARAAALCLERGGLISDAVLIYGRLGEQEKVGELYERLGQRDLAEQAYGRAVDARIQQADFLGAARLLDERLHAPQRAYQTLLLGWPNSAQAESCLDLSFGLCGRLGDHPLASANIERFSRSAAGQPVAVKLATVLSRVAQDYPHATVRDLAADHTRILAAGRLEQKLDSEREALLEAVRKLAPHDRLLSRDCDRYRQRHTAKPRTQSLPNAVRLLAEIQLPDGDWRSVVAYGQEFYAAGWRDSEVLLVRGLWDGQIHQPKGQPWRLPTEHAGAAIIMAIPPCDGAKLLVHVLGHHGLPRTREFPATDRMPARSAGRFLLTDETTLALDTGNGTIVSELKVVQTGLLVMCYQFPTGTVLSSRPIHLADYEQTAEPWLPRVFHDNGSRLFFGGPTGLYETCDQLGTPVLPRYDTAVHVCPGSIHQIATDDRYRLAAACMEEGGWFWWGNSAQTDRVRFGAGLATPRAAILKSQVLVAAGSGKVEAYSTHSHNLKLMGRIDVPIANPIAVLPLPYARRAAIFDQSGRVVICDTNPP